MPMPPSVNEWRKSRTDIKGDGIFYIQPLITLMHTDRELKKVRVKSAAIRVFNRLENFTC